MNGMLVCAQVFHRHTVSTPRPKHRLVSLRIGFSIDSPHLFVSMSLEFGIEGEVDTGDCVCVCLTRRCELVIVPDEIVRLCPSWFSGRVGVFNHYSHACGLNVFSN